MENTESESALESWNRIWTTCYHEYQFSKYLLSGLFMHSKFIGSISKLLCKIIILIILITTVHIFKSWNKPPEIVFRYVLKKTLHFSLFKCNFYYSHRICIRYLRIQIWKKGEKVPKFIPLRQYTSTIAYILLTLSVSICVSIYDV